MNWSSLSQNFGLGGRAISVVLGSLVILMAGLSLSNNLAASDIFSWTVDVLGLGFITLTLMLVFVSVFSSLKILGKRARSHQMKPMLSDASGCLADFRLATELQRLH